MSFKVVITFSFQVVRQSVSSLACMRTSIPEKSTSIICRCPVTHSIEVALQRGIVVDERNEGGPRQLSQQCRDNLEIGKCLDKADHVAQRFLRKTPAKLHLQLSRQRGDNLPAILRPLLPEDVLSHATPHIPILTLTGLASLAPSLHHSGWAGVGHLIVPVSAALHPRLLRLLQKRQRRL